MIYNQVRRSTLLLILFASFVFTACRNFYKATSSSTSNNVQKAASIDSLKTEQRYFILRRGSEEAYNMKNIKVRADQKSLTCDLDTISLNHKLHLVRGRGGDLRYKKQLPVDRFVLNEVHLYIPDDSVVTNGPYILSLDKIQKIEIIEKDRKRTTNSYVIGTIGYTIGTLALVGIIIAATKSSCPFVSAYDGNNFSLQGEIYGGAIYPQLARHDYMPLKMEPLSNGTLQLKISNELQEEQFTDMAELWMVTHEKNARVAADEQGALYSVALPQPPTYASLNDRKDVLAPLLNLGDNSMLYMDDTLSSTASNEVILKFSKPAATKKGKLVLSLKNSYFLDLLYGELAKGFGNYYSTYIQQQKKRPAAELLKWVKDQQIPLEVSIKTAVGWKTITDITTIGPLATRDIIVPVHLENDGENYIEIKLSSGFLFWEIDYAAIDYSREEQLSIQKMKPSRAVDENGKNILPQLREEDEVYLAQPQIGNIATITYRPVLSTDPAKARTYILHTKGYYEHVRHFAHPPNVAFLNQFKAPGAFPLYGLGVYKKISTQSLSVLAKTDQHHR